MTTIYRSTFTISLAAMLALLACPSLSAERMNVLFIAVDDLRPELGSYGHAVVKSPNIDRLAAEGIRFDRAYSQQAICAPSRISLLSGRRPETTEISKMRIRLSDVHPEFVTLPHHFKDNGYKTVSLGKVYHSIKDDPDAWSVKPWRPANSLFMNRVIYLDKNSIAEQQKNIAKIKNAYKEKVRYGLKIRKPNFWDIEGPSHEALNVADDAYPDGVTTNRAIKELNRPRDRPFFIAVGFYKPHLPFNVPKRYWDL